MADQNSTSGSKSGVIEGAEPAIKPAPPTKAATNPAKKPTAPTEAQGKPAPKGPVRKAVPAASAKKGEGNAKATKQAADQEPDDAELGTGRLRSFQLAFIVYGVSIAFHALVFLVLFLIVIEHPLVTEHLSIVSNKPMEEEQKLESMETETDPTELTETESTEESSNTENINDTPQNLAIDSPKDTDPSLMMETIDLGTAPSVTLEEEFGGRSEQARAKALKKNGGSEASEKAVMSGLKWIASVQLPDGSWDFSQIGKSSQPGTMEGPGSRMGATGMALLAFLGAGHTHERGSYAPNVEKGLQFLIKNMILTPEGGDLRAGHTGHEGMYVQGICTIALCEAFAMTPPKGKHRQNLKKAAEYAVMFICRAQDPKDGGWRYRPREPGDTSVVGWQVMALVSANAGGIAVPSNVLAGATNFLNHVTVDGSRYGYTDNTTPSNPRSAVALLCRMYLEKKNGAFSKNDAYARGVKILSDAGPDKNNMYYNYYGTQVMHHWGGEEWKKWNSVMRDHLVRTQIQEGVEEGSWNRTSDGSKGGRLYMTCLCVMTLEVYYRHLPLYQRQNVIDEDV